MPKNIKITKEQYKKLIESKEDDFSYLSNDDTKPCDGQLNITANGKVEYDKNGKPVKADDVQKMLTPQSYRRYRAYGNISPRCMREGVAIDDSNDFYDVGGFKNKELNTLTDDNEKDNLVKIPKGVENKINILLDSIKSSNLSPKQQAIVLNKIIEALNYDEIPNQWKKELINDLK